MKNQLEYIKSEQPAIALFQKMGYTYLAASALSEERTDIKTIVLEQRLKAALRRINPQLSETNIQKAYTAITTINTASLMETNQKTWELLRHGFDVKQNINGKEHIDTANYIDFNQPENNEFLVVNQLKIQGKGRHSVPDIVVYLNGLPIAVLECKSPTAKNAWDEAYADLQYYQENSEKLFHFNQLCVGLWKRGGRYGAINAAQQFYSHFRPSKTADLSFLGENPTAQDILLYALFDKKRLLDLICHFVLFEKSEGRSIKKLPRHQQWRATNKTIARLQEDKGGVVWHTQGSGKSLTMAYIARKLQASEYGFHNPTILILTDRKDLDQQITNTFQNVGFDDVNQALSVWHLKSLLSNSYGGIITTTLQKFQDSDSHKKEHEDETALAEQTGKKLEKYVKDGILFKITKVWKNGSWTVAKQEKIDLESLSDKENLYVLVDEAHRSHYGFLALFMRKALPKAKFVAFTGTPISKAEKSTLGEFYGGKYIDVYTIMEAVQDEATVALYYDQGIEQLSVKKESLDQEFEEKFGHFSAEKQDKLKRKALKDYALSEKRITDICKDIVQHYKGKIFANGHKAMIVCGGRTAAVNYQKALHKLREQGFHDFESKVVVSLGSPKNDKIARECYETLAYNKENPATPKPLWVVPTEQIKAVIDNFKFPFESKEEEGNRKQKHYDNTAFIIVSDMLLTGWDAPIASCLYLDKPLKEHNLLQAIARVNRTRTGKNAGFILDYNGITADLKKALEIFSGDVQPNDILKNLNEEIPRLAMNHHKLIDFFRPIKIDRNYERASYIDKTIQFLEPIDRRDSFKSLLKAFNSSLALVLPNEAALKYYKDFKLFNEIKAILRNVFPADEDLSITQGESLLLQKMIDKHLQSKGVRHLLAEPISIIDKDKFAEATADVSPATKELMMKNKLKYTIKVGLDKNPDFYKPLAERLDELLKQRKENRLSQLDLLRAFAQMSQHITDEKEQTAKHGFESTAEQAIYSSMQLVFEKNAVAMTKKMFSDISAELQIIQWRKKRSVKKEIEVKIRTLLLQKMEREAARKKATAMMNILIKNEDA